MKQSGAVGRLASLRQMAHRFAFAMLVLAAVGLMLLGKADIILIERARTMVVDAIVPILDALSRPASTVADLSESVRELAALRAENARLKQENLRLMQWQTIARRQHAENAQLREQLNVIPDPDPAFVTARVVGELGSAFGRSLLLNAGARDGVRKGQAVLSGEHLVGYVADVGDRSSRLLLITDINSRIPAMVESSRMRAVLTGDNRDRPRLARFSAAGAVPVGERVVTSFAGGAFPPGIPIGVVASTADGIIRVEPFVKSHELEFVTIVDYGLGGIQTFEKPPMPERRRRGGGAEN